MLTRRGFFGRVIGGLAAAYAAPRALIGRAGHVYRVAYGSATPDRSAGTYSYHYTYYHRETGHETTTGAGHPPQSLG